MPSTQDEPYIIVYSVDEENANNSEGYIINAINAYDQDWSTKAEVDSMGCGDNVCDRGGNIYENYTIPNYINLTNWSIKYGLKNTTV